LSFFLVILNNIYALGVSYLALNYENFYEKITYDGAKKYTYKRKNIENKHIGIQKIYTSEGYLSIEFFHIYGIKNGEYKIYDFYNNDLNKVE
jgi:hypothetical protein